MRTGAALLWQKDSGLKDENVEKAAWLAGSFFSIEGLSRITALQLKRRQKVGLGGDYEQTDQDT